MEGEVWIGIAFATEYRLMLSFMIDTQEAYLAEPLIASTEERLKAGSWPVWVSDGLDAYGEALKGRHCTLQYYPRTECVNGFETPWTRNYCSKYSV